MSGNDLMQAVRAGSNRGASQHVAPGGGASQPVAPGGGSSQPTRSEKPVEILMEAIRELGRLPKESRGASKKERSLAEKLRDHKKRGNLSEEHKAELAAMSFKVLLENFKKYALRATPWIRSTRRLPIGSNRTCSWP